MEDRSSEALRGEGSRAAVRLSLSWQQLPVRVRTSVPLSDDQLLELCRANADLQIERTAQGELVIMSPTGGETGRRNAKLLARLVVWAEADGSGVVFDSSTGFILPNGAERAPDASWLRRERWDALGSDRQQRLVSVVPEFVLELRSPTDSVVELRAKMQEYMDNGAELGWLIETDPPRATVYRRGAEPQVLDAPDVLRGDPVLPGFVLDLKSLDR